MTIQIPNPGTGNGASGDNEFVLWSKVKDNFSDQTNAASKLVGTAAGQIPLTQQVRTVMYGQTIPVDTGRSFDAFEAGTIFYSGIMNLGRPAQEGKVNYVVETIKSGYTGILQKAISEVSGCMYIRSSLDGLVWKAWSPCGQTPSVYETTTATGANVAVDTTGKLMRSTSSERYKDILAPLELDDARYDDAMALKPIVYRSIADADNPAYHYYSFSAEELGAYDPAFTLWRETEMVTDEDGNVTEQVLAERQAEGININALLAMGHAIAIKQGELIKGLQEQINALKPKPEV